MVPLEMIYYVLPNLNNTIITTSDIQPTNRDPRSTRFKIVPEDPSISYTGCDKNGFGQLFG